jgi:antitoxin HicB
MKYPAKFEPADEGGFVVEFPDFGWGVTQGNSEQEAKRMARDLLVSLIQSDIQDGKDLPRPGNARGRKFRLIELPALASVKAELYTAFLASGVRKAELARRLSIPKTVVDRLFDLNHHTRMEQLEAAFAVLKKRLEILVRDAA